MLPVHLPGCSGKGYALAGKEWVSAISTGGPADSYQAGGYNGFRNSLIEKQVASSQQQLLAAVDALAKNAPAGSEGAVKLLRQSVVEANTAFEKVQAASRQVLDLIDANVNNLAKKGEAAAKKK